MNNNLLLALDPGMRNFGYAIVDLSTNKLLRNGMNPYPVSSLNHNELPTQNKMFSTWVAKHKKTGCNFVVAERFQVRSSLHGTSCEAVSFMLGVLSKIIPRYRFIIASQWKNEYNRQGLVLEEIYQAVKPLTPHQADAVCISFWTLCRLKKFKLPSQDFIIRSIKETADDPLPKVKIVNKKKRKRRPR